MAPPRRGGGFNDKRLENFFVKNKGAKIPLPEPIELAKLAAILRPEFEAAAGLKVAMQFYVEAVLFCRESASMSFEDLIARFGSDSLGCVSAIDSDGRTIWIADAHRDDGKRFIVRADEKLTAFLELESAIRDG
jgi:hypothetical protein